MIFASVSLDDSLIVIGIIVGLASAIKAVPTCWKAFKGFIAWADTQPKLSTLPEDIEYLKGSHRSLQAGQNEMKAGLGAVAQEVRGVRDELVQHMAKEGTTISEIKETAEDTNRRVQEEALKTENRHTEFQEHVSDDISQFGEVKEAIHDLSTHLGGG